ncbi:MAG: hypothetical protein M5R36_28910 [Deltaproteobacteria bacterium]|nr:hypothetical protein [Deltaproteobacteria bacterium]
MRDHFPRRSPLAAFSLEWTDQEVRLNDYKLFPVEKTEEQENFKPVAGEAWSRRFLEKMAAEQEEASRNCSVEIDWLNELIAETRKTCVPRPTSVSGNRRACEMSLYQAAFAEKREWIESISPTTRIRWISRLSADIRKRLWSV